MIDQTVISDDEGGGNAERWGNISDIAHEYAEPQLHVLPHMHMLMPCGAIPRFAMDPGVELNSKLPSSLNWSLPSFVHPNLLASFCE